MNARSTVGQVAAKAGTSMHKARQAIAVQKAIEAGEPATAAASRGQSRPASAARRRAAKASPGMSRSQSLSSQRIASSGETIRTRDE